MSHMPLPSAQTACGRCPRYARRARWVANPVATLREDRPPMPATAEQPPLVDEPQHPLAQLTTYELAAYLRQLQAAVAFFEKTQAPVLARLRDKLAQVVAEEEDRARLARA
jgi:hypothetical protein